MYPMNHYTIAKACAIAAGLVLPTVSWAGTVIEGKEAKPILEQVKETCITGDLGINFVSEYISRGLVLENQGAIAQPFADLYFRLYQGDGFINKVSLNLGVWNSIHSHVQGSGSTSGHWYEFDYTAGVAVTFAKNFTGTLSYFEFISPADAFTTARMLNFNLAYDDTDLLGAFALHPHVVALAELDGAAGLQDNGFYFEAGIAPSYSPCKALTFTLPVTAGFGDKKFYAGDNFGYVSGGVTATAPLTFIPSCYGTWTANAGYTYYYLGNSVADATATGHQSQHVFQTGLTVAF